MFCRMDARRTEGTVALAAMALILALAPTQAHASDPSVAVLPVTGDGVTGAMFDIVHDTITVRAGKQGWSVAPASKVSSAASTICGDDTCTTGEAVAVGKAASATHVLSTVVEETGAGLNLRMVLFDVATGKTGKAATATDTSGILASAVKLMKKVLPEASSLASPVVEDKPAPQTYKKPEPAPPAETYEKPEPPPPAKTYKKPVTHESKPKVSLELEPPDTGAGDAALAEHVDGEFEKLYRRSTGLLAVGGLLTLGGVALTVTSVVKWVSFVEWQKKARDDQCLECIDQADDKIKTNAIITGVAAGVLLPGIITLGAGITQRMLAVKMREKAAAFMPDLNLALAPDGGYLSATWTF